MTSLQEHHLKAIFMSVAQFDAEMVQMYDISGLNELIANPKSETGFKCGQPHIQQVGI